jgi:hypothetical protein
VENNLFTDIFADGCNLNNVSLTGTSGSNLTATNNFIRGTGDDGMAINSVAYNTNGTTTYTAMTNITMTHNTVIAPWGGKGIGVYGGSGHLVENNYIADTARYIGLGVGPLRGQRQRHDRRHRLRQRVVRSGGNAYFQGQPALQIGNGGDGQNVGTVTDATSPTTRSSTGLRRASTSPPPRTPPWPTTRSSPVAQRHRDLAAVLPGAHRQRHLHRQLVTGLASGMSAYLNDSSGFTATLSDNSWQNGATEGPYGGTPAAVPGTVQAENYDTGGQGVGYNVTSTNGTGNSYRSDGVDLETTSDTGGGYDLGWTRPGSGSSTPSTSPRPGPTPSASGSRRPRP